VEWSDDGADILFPTSNSSKLKIHTNSENLREKYSHGFSRISRISVGPEKYFLQQKEKK